MSRGLNDHRARIYVSFADEDRVRAMELVRRTDLAEAELAYLRNGSHVPGGLDYAAQSGLNHMVRANLLSEGVFSGDNLVEGFVVVDTGVALPTLAGTSIQAVAHRLGDASPASGTYQFPGAPPTPSSFSSPGWPMTARRSPTTRSRSRREPDSGGRWCVPIPISK